jgi:hypothetical protein
MDFHEIWYGCYIIVEHSELCFLILHVSNISVMNAVSMGGMMRIPFITYDPQLIHDDIIGLMVVISGSDSFYAYGNSGMAGWIFIEAKSKILLLLFFGRDIGPC